MKKKHLLVFFLLVSIIIVVTLLAVKKAVWDGRHQINFVIEGNPLIIASFNPADDKSLNLLTIPSSTLIETIHGYGQYKVEAISKLGQLEGRGEDLLTGSLEEFFSVPIDGYLSPFSPQDLTLADPAAIKKGISATLLDLVKGRGKTNLTKLDLFRLWWQVRKVRADKIKAVNLNETAVFSLTTLADGTSAGEIDAESVGELVVKLFEDRQIRTEDLAISVLNGTSHFGLANKAAQKVSNLGGRIIEIGVAAGEKEKCEVKTEKANRLNYTVKKLMGIFHCRWVEGGPGEYRGQVALILGEDYWRKLMVK